MKGIGTRARTFFGRGPAEAFGFGGHRRVRQAMERLENNLDAGDTNVDVIGFSRGAALAMSFANEIASKLPDVEIRFVGVFDVVAQFGLPGQHVNAGHVVSLPRNVKCCRHAMAMDETRALFPLTRLCNKDGSHDDRLVELWFRGVHSDVGGGNANRGLNWIALNWMFMNALRADLPIAKEAVERNLQDRNLPQEISAHKLDSHLERHFLAADCLHSYRGPRARRRRPSAQRSKIALKRINDEGRFVETQNV